MSLKSICLCMIVKNESKIIQRCLNALKPHIDYWVIVDTGSSDNTKEIIRDTLKDIPGELLDRPWVSFGYNRTESLQLSKNKADYILLCDADEEMIVDPEFSNFNLQSDAYSIQYTGNLLYSVPYLLKNGLDWSYKGVTHEYLACTSSFNTSYMPHIKINHHCDGGGRSEKFQRDIELLEQGIKDEPNNSRYYFYLANSYRDIGSHIKAIENYQQRQKMGGWIEEVWNSLYHEGLCENKLGNHQLACEKLLDAYNMLPNRAESLYHLARINRELGKNALCYLYSSWGCNIATPSNGLFVETRIYNYLMKFEKSISSFYCGSKAESKALTKELIQRKDLDPITRKFAEQNLKFF